MLFNLLVKSTGPSPFATNKFYTEQTVFSLEKLNEMKSVFQLLVESSRRQIIESED